MKFFTTFFLSAILLTAKAQTFDDWKHTVNWDGASHWSTYIKTTAAFMGPNALAVPLISNGSIDSSVSASLTGQLHFSNGDKTQSIVLYGNYCLVKNVISFDVSYIPYEFYTMSDEIKKERHVYYQYYNDKKARGDFLVNTTIQLFNKHRKKTQMALRLGYRLPSSSGFGAARFMDAMAYTIDLSFAKPFHSIPLKWISMAGIYCWQIQREDLRQNDAFLFGTGLEWNPKTWRIQTYVAGYLGYMYKSGDKPIVFRAEAQKKLQKTSLLLRFQQGMHDFKYSTVEFGGRYFFKQ